MKRYRTALTALIPDGWTVRESIEFASPEGEGYVVAAADVLPSTLTAEEYAERYGKQLSERLPEYEELQVEAIGESAEYRRAAEAQGFCAVSHGNPLGSMGTPVKLTVKGRLVFLCCEGCTDAARSQPDKTLATVERLKNKAAARRK